MLEPAHIRAARALLGWKQEDLARAAKIGIATVQRLEVGGQSGAGHMSTWVRVESALEKAGILFIPADDSGGIGVRLVGKNLKSRR